MPRPHKWTDVTGGGFASHKMQKNGKGKERDSKDTRNAKLRHAAAAQMSRDAAYSMRSTSGSNFLFAFVPLRLPVGSSFIGLVTYTAMCAAYRYHMLNNKVKMSRKCC